MQEQDKEFKIGQKVRYLGGNAYIVLLYTGEVGDVVESDMIGWSECVKARFVSKYQIVLKSCLEIVE